MKKRNLKTVCIIIGIIAVIVITFCTFVLPTESFQRFVKDITSDYNGGIERTISVYDYNGELIREYKGKFDVEYKNDGTVKFDNNGKRTTITGGIIINEEE